MSPGLLPGLLHKLRDLLFLGEIKKMAGLATNVVKDKPVMGAPK
jgi:hypothetical protein